ncbi:DUF3905 domain-containing protein [Evansella cellulosilytica]|uniref:Uncharacterized protein n=1 Tax=Evansella cellulosilytica (strain ATCC 21833 / DSM 2522 / FERM P-1141 / JCM 9156 / N-4) TaxID=649639 RepID=E6TSY1_EVAC2|nr:DUF3905 domain-containing protein [Evansella cellulosilytica]ADU30773.1 hypothetical protein Bcell_2516 [Evansella cellulosilytica DSM 2522]
MKKKREFEANPETPLDHWSINIDPAIMSGDHWVEEEEAPISDSDSSKIKLSTRMGKHFQTEQFMHPTHNVGEKNWNKDEE